MKKGRLPLFLIITALFTLCVAVLLSARYYSDAMPALGGPSETSDNDLVTDGSININIATEEELCMLPGIGEALAQRIVIYRQENGPFHQITDLKNIKGISEALLNKIADYITVGS